VPIADLNDKKLVGVNTYNLPPLISTGNCFIRVVPASNPDTAFFVSYTTATGFSIGLQDVYK
jgi:hypothetical protein